MTGAVPPAQTEAVEIETAEIPGPILIATHDAHAAALAEIDRLWETPAGSPDSDRLEALVDAVVAYEEIHWPIEIPTAAELLAWVLKETEQDAEDGAEAIDTGASTGVNTGGIHGVVAGIVGGQAALDEILAGTRSITPDLLVLLSLVPGLELLRPGEAPEQDAPAPDDQEPLVFCPAEDKGMSAEPIPDHGAAASVAPIAAAGGEDRAPVIHWRLPPDRLTAHQRMRLAVEIRQDLPDHDAPRVRFLDLETAFLIYRSDPMIASPCREMLRAEGRLQPPTVRVEPLGITIACRCRPDAPAPTVEIRTRTTRGAVHAYGFQGPAALRDIETVIEALLTSGSLRPYGLGKGETHGPVSLDGLHFRAEKRILHDRRAPAKRSFLELLGKAQRARARRMRDRRRPR